jgi:general secretion pathway protein M
MNAFWAARSPRERAILAGGGAVLAALLLIVFAWLPLERSRARLATEVPRLAASVATMEGQAAEVVRVRSLPATPSSGATPSAAIAAALGTRLPGAQASAVDEKRVRVTGSDVSYGALLETIASAQGTYGMRVDSARIDALSTAGRVRVELLLARS